MKKKINQYFSEFCRKRIFIFTLGLNKFCLYRNFLKEVGSPIEEIVKDADVLDFYQYGYKMARPERPARLEKLLSKR